MLTKMLKSKIHRATVTQADLNYEGSISISPELLAVADLHEFEAVNIWNVTQGTRFETYTIKGLPGSNDICVNGAAAHLVKPGDLIIIASFVMLNEQELKTHVPKAIFVDNQNKFKEKRPELAGPHTTSLTCN